MLKFPLGSIKYLSITRCLTLANAERGKSIKGLKVAVLLVLFIFNRRWLLLAIVWIEPSGKIKTYGALPTIF